MLIRSFSILALFVVALPAYASLDQAPPSFPYRDGFDAVYVDFQTANYHLTYDFSNREVRVDSEIVFEMPKSGFPIFDLVAEPTAISLDGESASQELISDPDGISKFRIVKSETGRNQTSQGRHTLRISHLLTKNVKFKSEGVASAFWTSDLDDRQYLEQYLPASFEYDSVDMHFMVEILGADGIRHVVHANGAVTEIGTNRFTIDFPEFFTASSLFFHLMPEDAVPARAFTYRSVDGRDLQVEIYTPFGLNAFEEETRRVLSELEKDYGAFPHPKVVIYGTSPGTGGMEYSGATMSSKWALGHELFHSYNARSVMPANGNAGWIDEATSSWRDNAYTLRTSPGFSSTKMAGHSLWTRMTDDAAYGNGAKFLAWIANRMKEKGGDLKVYLRDYFARHRHSTVTTELFRDELITLAGLDVAADFDRYIYGKSDRTQPDGEESPTTWPSARTNQACDLPATETGKFRRENPYHPRLTDAQLETLLWP